MSATRIDELIRAFDLPDDAYKREEVEEALTLREEITPRLLRILEEVADDPMGWTLEERNVHAYAAILLAHLREPAAHLPVIRAFSIPREQQEEIWGDMIFQTLPALLLRTCNGDLATVRELVLDRAVPEYVRFAAMEALTFAVGLGMTGREEVVPLLAGLLTGTEADPGSDYWNNVVCSLCDLHPGDSLAVIRQAYADGLVSPEYVDTSDVERDLARDREDVLAQLRRTSEGRVPEDVHEYLSMFAGYRKEAYGPVRPLSSPVECARRRQENRKKKSRAKNRQAKKARKKNRR
ncbi:MAG: DUF1186 domain-containing protein [Desulfobulbaceae bacterium]